MGIVTTDDRHYKAIANTIRENAPIEDKFTSAELAGGVESACSYQRAEGYQEGHAEGKAEGKEEGITEGIQTEYDRFWDVYQPTETASYRYKFAGAGWTAETFRPKRSIRPTSANQMFAYSEALNISLPDHFEMLGIDLDFSSCTSFSETFLYSAITEVGTIDTRSASSISHLFRYAQALVTVQNLILKENGLQTVANTTFQNTGALENLTITGVIGKSGLDLSASIKLSKASITSVVNALSTTTSGLSVTLSKTSVNNAFSGGSTGAEWTALANTKSNWTINLV